MTGSLPFPIRKKQIYSLKRMRINTRNKNRNRKKKKK